MDMEIASTPTSLILPARGKQVKKKARENLSAPWVKFKKASGKTESFKINRNFDLID